MTAPEFPVDRGFPEPSQATTALALGVIGLVVQILAPFAMLVATREIAGIESVRRDPDGLQTAQTARVLGIIGVCILGLELLAVVLLLGFLRVSF